jgi:hypothetical protein
MPNVAGCIRIPRRIEHLYEDTQHGTPAVPLGLNRVRAFVRSIVAGGAAAFRN